MKPSAWSFTALENFLNCPKQFYHLRVAKDVADTKGEAALWGDFVHKAFEAYLRSGTPLPESLAQHKAGLDWFKTLPGELLVEQQLAINKSLQRCSWFDKSAWLRVIMDVLVLDRAAGVAHVWDHKTGKRKEGHRQLKLFALAVFILEPEIHTVHTGYNWMQTGQRDQATYHRHEVDSLFGEFSSDLRKFASAFKSEEFPPRRSGLCNGWCPVKNCEHWSPKR